MTTVPRSTRPAALGPRQESENSIATRHASDGGSSRRGSPSRNRRDRSRQSRSPGSESQPDDGSSPIGFLAASLARFGRAVAQIQTLTEAGDQLPNRRAGCGRETKAYAVYANIRRARGRRPPGQSQEVA
jgi:hypothetical protein